MATPSTRQPTFAEAAAAWVYLQRSPHTRDAYRRDLQRFSDWCSSTERHPLTSGRSAAVGYRTSCETQGLSPATITRRLATLGSFFARHPDLAGVEAAAWAGPSMQGATRAVGSDDDRSSGLRASPPDARAALSAVDGEEVLRAAQALGSRAETLVALLMFDGLGLGEIVVCDRSHVECRIHEVILTIHGRSGEAFSVSDRAASALRRHLGGVGLHSTDGPLLIAEQPGREPTRLTRFGADYVIKQIAREGGLGPLLSANALRRWFAQQAAASGLSVRDIARRMGHSDPRTTRRLLDGT